MVFLVLSFAVPVMAQTTFSCPANQYVSSQLVNTGQGCSALAGTTLTGVGAGTAPASSGTYNFSNNPVTAAVLTDTGLAAVAGAGVASDYTGKIQSVRSPSMFKCFGNSYIAGTGVANPATQAICNVFSSWVQAPAKIIGVPGASAGFISTSLLFPNFIYDPANTVATVFNSAENDATADTCGGVINTACTYDFQNIVGAMIAWTAIPISQRYMASTFTTSGAWTNDTTIAYYTPTATTSPGTALKTSASGASLTKTISTTTGQTALGVTYVDTNGQTGTWTLSIDGTPQTNVCTGTTTFSSAPCKSAGLVSGATSAFMRQQFTMGAATSHTIVITSTAAANSGIGWIDVPVAGGSNANTVVALGGSVASGFTNIALYDTLIANKIAELAAVGQKVGFANLDAATPGPLLTAADFGATTATCPGTGSGQHPNPCGAYKMAQSIQNAAAAIGVAFSVPGSNSFATSGAIGSPWCRRLRIPVMPLLRTS